MSTSVQGRWVRPLTDGMFADLTDTPLVAYDREGLLFDGTLTDTQVLDIWWRWTTPDDEAETRLRAVAEALASDATASPLSQRIAEHLLGMEGS